MNVRCYVQKKIDRNGQKILFKEWDFSRLKKTTKNSPLSEDVYPVAAATSDVHPQMVVQMEEEPGAANGQSAIACGLET